MFGLVRGAVTLGKARDVNRLHRHAISSGMWVLWPVVYVVVAAWPLAVGVVRPGITGYERCQLPEHVYGQAYRPYVKRQLVPLVVRAGVAVMPEEWKAGTRSFFEQSPVIARLRWDPGYAPEFVLALVVMYFSLLAFLMVLRRLLLACLELRPSWSHLVVLAVGIGLPITFAGKLYIYDFTQLFLFTAALVLMYRHCWWAYYPLFALACVNKETSILLALVFVFWQGLNGFKIGRDVRIITAVHAATQWGLGLSILVAIAWIFRNNPGGEAEFHLWRNLGGGFTPLAWMRLVVLTMAIVLSLWRIRWAPRFFSCGLAATLPVLLAAMLFLGYIDELRNAYESLPFVVGLTVLALGWRWGVRAREECVRGSPQGACGLPGA